MSKRSSVLLIADIKEALDKISDYKSGLSKEAFHNDHKTIDSVVRNLEIIGEAANRLPADFKTNHSAIEWEKIIGLRHRIIHEYFGIDLGIIWHILENDLPSLRTQIGQIKS